MRFFLSIVCAAGFLFSCNQILKPKVKNSDIVKLPNGMGRLDTVRYTCDSCEKYLQTVEMVNLIIDHATKEAKNSLNNPLSFVPRAIKMQVSKEDSIYYYDSNKRVDSCLMINVDYECIGKNAYGTEGLVNSKSLLFLVGNSIKDNFVEQVRLRPLATANDGKTVNRILKLADVDGDGSFTVLPTLSVPYSLIVKSSMSCIDKDARLTIKLENNGDIHLNNWNDFNCNGTAYFSLNESTISALAKEKIRYISFYSGKTQLAMLPANQTDYLMQYVQLLGREGRP